MKLAAGTLIRLTKKLNNFPQKLSDKKESLY